MADLKLVNVPLDWLHPNPWNPNAMDPEMFGKAVESIHSFGFIDPVTVRELPIDQRLEIVDGEHRWKAASEHSGACLFHVDQQTGKRVYTSHVPMGKIPVISIGHVSDEVAKQLTIVLNETRGTYDAKKMGQLLTELVAVKPLPELVTVLPFTKDKIEELAELPKVDWNRIPSAPRSGRAEKWVERVYRLPKEAAEKLDEAIGAARDEPGTPDWRALQTIAEDFLSS